MKNFLLAFYCMVAATVYSQDSLLLHTTFLPMRVYNQSVTQKFHLVMRYTGNDSLLNALKQKRVDNPTIMDRESHLTSITTTGAYNDKKIMPVELIFKSAEDKDGKVIIPKNTRMLGKVANNAMPVYDSVISNDMDSAAKAQFIQSFKNILSQIFLPDKRMAIGDTFTMTSPINFPAGIVNIRMIFSTTYKLLSIKNNIAHFSINIKYTLNMDVKDMAATGGGSGAGLMDIDLINKYPLKYTSDYIMNISASKDGDGINVMLSGSSDSENTITKKQ